MKNAELIARLHHDARVDSIMGDDVRKKDTEKAADAIEALEAERDSLAHHLNRQKQWKDAMRDKMQTLRYELDAVPAIKAERDALRAQLAAAQGQSLPVLQVSAFVEGFLEEVEEPPGRNCRCHISPPCNDCVDHSSLRELFSDARRLVKTISELKAAPIPQKPAWAPMTLDEAKALTAMVYGAPWSNNYCEGLLDVLAMYDELRFTGQRPVDPASPQPKETK